MKSLLPVAFASRQGLSFEIGLPPNEPHLIFVGFLCLLILVALLYEIFLRKIQNLHPNSFLPEQFLICFGFKIVCQLLARHLLKKIERLKRYSDRLKLFFAEIRPTFTCTYCVNKWKSILVINHSACQKRIVDIGYIPCITHIHQFSWRRQKEKNQLSASEWFQFGKNIRIITKNVYQVTEVMTHFPTQDSKSTSKLFSTRTVFNLFWL